MTVHLGNAQHDPSQVFSGVISGMSPALIRG